MVDHTDTEGGFGLVPQVKIQAVDDRTVSFATRSAGPSGDANGALLKTFTVPLSEIYTAPIAGAPASVAMQPGATGPLYLSREGWNTSTPDGFKIFGGERAAIKFPDRAGIPTPPLTRLVVIPTSMIVRGQLQDETAFFDLELLGSDPAPSQDILWNGVDYIQLQLTPRGAERLRIRSGSTTVKVWPTRITVKGSPAIDSTVLGEADVLDVELADGAQHIVFAKPGAPVTLMLTQDGVDAFHVTPQAVEELSGDVEFVPRSTAA